MYQALLRLAAKFPLEQLRAGTFSKNVGEQSMFRLTGQSEVDEDVWQIGVAGRNGFVEDSG